MKIPLFIAAFLLAACTNETVQEVAVPKSDPADIFFAKLTNMCGNAYEGKVTSTDEADTGFASEHLVMQILACSDDTIRIPFHVGADRSRTWVVTRNDNGLRLKHDHRHEDGTKDAVTQYGGDSGKVGSERVEFPVDQFSIDLFNREGLTASVTNVWAMEVNDVMFAYELSRENRFFRVEFDLENAVPAPPAPW